MRARTAPLFALLVLLLPTTIAQEEPRREIVIEVRDEGPCPGDAPTPCLVPDIVRLAVGERVTFVFVEGQGFHGYRLADEPSAAILEGEGRVDFDATEAGEHEVFCDVHPETERLLVVVANERATRGSLRAAFDLGVSDGSLVETDASASVATEAPIVAYVWDWGDGTPPETTTSPKATHRYGPVLSPEIRLIVRDADGFEAEARPLQADVTTRESPRGVEVRVRASGCDGTAPCFSSPYLDVWPGEWVHFKIVIGEGVEGTHRFRIGDVETAPLSAGGQAGLGPLQVDPRMELRGLDARSLRLPIVLRGETPAATSADAPLGIAVAAGGILLAALASRRRS